MNYSTDTFARGIDCPKCGEPMDVEDGLEQLCFEPFNGVVMECDDADCDGEVSLDMRVEVTELN